jgi:hypothetical protein
VLSYTFNKVFKDGEYYVAKYNIPKSANDALYIATSDLKRDYMSMALYSIAIYDRALSDQEVQEVINFMNKDNKS